METPRLEIRRGILNENDEIDRSLRSRLHPAGLSAVNLAYSPGSGKTAFLQRTLRTMRQQGCSTRALVGDLTTNNDARRLAEAGGPGGQVNTKGRSDPEVQMVTDYLFDWDLNDFEYLFVENVGNLVCLRATTLEKI
jgi:hydrogenase nickel incorporation protein HypB